MSMPHCIRRRRHFKDMLTAIVIVSIEELPTPSICRWRCEDTLTTLSYRRHQIIVNAALLHRSMHLLPTHFASVSIGPTSRVTDSSHECRCFFFSAQRWICRWTYTDDDRRWLHCVGIGYVDAFFKLHRQLAKGLFIVVINNFESQCRP